MADEKSLQQYLAETVIIVRTLRGMTQAELAARSRLSDVYIRQIERGERDVSIGSLEKLAAGLSCDPGELIGSGGRSAICQLIGEAFRAASEEDKRAALFVLRPEQGERSETKKALLSLLAREIEPLTPAPVTPRGSKKAVAKRRRKR